MWGARRHVGPGLIICRGLCRCGHCQKLAPEWRDAATRLKKSAKLGAVDCTGDDKEICSKYGVRGFPSIKVFVKDKDKEPTDYTGARDADGIESFVTGEASKVRPPPCAGAARAAG